MIIRFISLMLLAFVSYNVHAQVTGPSFFPQMKAVNPAAINGRTIGMFSAGALKDQITKDQDISTPTASTQGGSGFGSGSTAKTEIDLTRFQAFYGGKGGGLTTEFTANNASGTKDFTLSQPGQSQTSETDVTSTFMNLGVGLGKLLGVSAGLISEEFNYNENFSFGGQSFNSQFKTEISGMILRGGVIIPMGFNLSVYYEHAVAEFKAAGTGFNQTSETNFGRVGLGFGINGAKTRFEVAYERDIAYEAPENAAPEQEDLAPSRATLTLEMKLGGFTLGYTGRYYIDGFADLENLTYNNLIYASAFEEARLENFINFALGQSKGHSFSGSLYVTSTETDEGIPNLIDGNKYATTIEAQGASVQYGYSW
jgi:hypothetical protein